MGGPMSVPMPRRPRRLRSNAVIREAVREHCVFREDLVMPVFVQAGTGIRREIGSMPGIHNQSLDQLPREIDAILDAGVHKVLLFGVPEHKDAVGSDTW